MTLRRAGIGLLALALAACEPAAPPAPAPAPGDSPQTQASPGDPGTGPPAEDLDPEPPFPAEGRPDPFVRDECAAGTHLCAPDAECVDTPGYHDCRCPEGWRGDGWSEEVHGTGCEDIDECADGTSDCGPDATCVNTPGGHSCGCPEGFAEDEAGCVALWSQVSAGQKATCAVRADGALWCWGNSCDGPSKGSALGHGDGVCADVPTPQRLGFAGERWLAVATGRDHGCAVKRDPACEAEGTGVMACWGYGNQGRVGAGDPRTTVAPVQVAGGGCWTRPIVGPGDHSCGLRPDGSLWCWGGNSQGQLGLVEADGAVRFSPQETTPRRVGADPGDSWVDAASALYNTVAVRDDGTLWIWGDSARRAEVARAAELPCAPESACAGVRWRSVVFTSTSLRCAVDVDGGLWCSGQGRGGQHGLGHTDRVDSPERVELGGAPVVSLSAGSARGVRAGDAVHACAVDEQGALWCWGRGDRGQVGDGGLARDQLVPVQVAEERTWASVSAGYRHTCAITRPDGDAPGGRLHCWGSLGQGQTGLGVTGTQLSPRRLLAGQGAQRVLADQDATCVLKEGAPARCWGRTPPPEGRDWADLTFGAGFGCGVDGDGAMWCWGANADGQLGAGDQLPRDEAVRIGPDRAWRDVEAGERHACAIDDGGALHCWGYHLSGRGGHGDGVPRRAPTPVDVQGVSWAKVRLGYETSCGIDAGGGLWCWGEGRYGVRGAECAAAHSPARVGDEGGWTDVATARYRTCGVREGELWCWGGIRPCQGGVQQAAQLPARICVDPAADGEAADCTPGEADWTGVSAGAQCNVCATRRGGGEGPAETVSCWVCPGSAAAQHQLGHGAYAYNIDANRRFFQPIVPLALLGLEGVVAVDLGGGHACARTATGAVFCWGANDDGQLGLPAFASRPLLVGGR